MKIVYLTDKIVNNSVGKVVLTEAEGMAEMGHQVFIICGRVEKDIKNFYSNIKWFDLCCREYGKLRYIMSLLPSSRTRMVKQILHSLRPDVLHLHNIHQYFSFFLLFGIKKYVNKVFLTCHDVMSFHYGKLVEFIPQDITEMRYDPDLLNFKYSYKVNNIQQIKRFKKRFILGRKLLIRNYLKNLDLVFTVSQELKKVLIANKVLPLEKIKILYNPVKCEDFAVDSRLVDEFKRKNNLWDKKIILFGGRISYHKGYRQFLNALSKLITKDSKVVGMILGLNENTKYKLKSEFPSRHLWKNLYLSKYLHSKDYPTAVCAADMVAVPSLCFDSAPLMAMEAMACKKPVVATCFGGAKEIVRHKETGYIVNPFNIDELAERLEDIVLDDKRAREFGRRGFEVVKNNFSVKKHLDNLFKFYNS